MNDFEQYLEDFSEDISSQSEELAKEYEDFSIEKECENPDFVNMLGCGISVKSAYEALHNDVLRSSTERKVRSNLRRPTENGVSFGGTSGFKNSASALSRKDRAEIADRVMKGEKIIF